jgi:hypothetical protein
MSISDRFTKVSDELVALGLPIRLAMLYGKLAFHAGADGRCFPTWATLAKEIGLKKTEDNTTVHRLLRQLRALKLVEWKRQGPHPNQYQVLTPDLAFLQGLALQKCKVKTLQDCNAEKNKKKRSIEKKATPAIERKTTSLVARQNTDVRVPNSRHDAASENRAASAVTVPENAAAPDMFHEFVGVFLAAGKKLNERDIERALKLWLNSDPPEHAVILEHLKRSVVDGTWSDARYTPMPASYLESKAWTRTGPSRVLPRPPKSEADSGIRKAAARFRRGER